MKFSGAVFLPIVRRALIAVLGTALLLFGFLILRALLKGPSAEAATNTYNPGFCLGGWENPEAAAGKPGKSAPNGGSAAAYLAPEVFAQIFCGYFSVTPREKPPKAVVVDFAFSFSGEEPLEEVLGEDIVVEEDPNTDEKENSDEDSGGGGGSGGGSEVPQEEPPAEETPQEQPTEEPPAEEVAPEESPAEEAPEEQSPEEEPETESSEPVSFLRFFTRTAHAQESSGAENLLVVSYSFDGVRWYAGGRVTRENAENFSMQVPATMWNDVQNLQVMVAPLPISGERPDIFLESLELKVEADLTLTEMAADGVAVVGGVIGEVLGLADEVQTAAVAVVTPQALPPAPPAKVKKLFYEIAGNPINAEGAGREVPNLTLEDEGTTLRVAGECQDEYFVLLTYRSPEDFTEKPRSFVSNYADKCRGGTFTHRMSHLPLDTAEDVYYLLVAEQGDEGSWVPTSPLVPIKIGQKEVEPVAED